MIIRKNECILSNGTKIITDQDYITKILSMENKLNIHDIIMLKIKNYVKKEK